MTDNVEKFYPKNAAENPDNVLEQAIGDFDEVLVIGWGKDGLIDARATTNFKDGGEVLWLIEVFKTKLMAGDYGEAGE